MQSRVTAPSLREMKERGEKITVLTAYDCPTAKLMDEAGVDVILVGDSVGMVALGFENTLPVTMDMMIHHTSAVVRGTKHALVVADMPFLSYQTSIEDAARNAGRMLQEAGAQAVKLEGGAAALPVVKKLTGMGIPVMGHLGLIPQSVHQFGGYSIQGRGDDAALQLRQDAKALQEAGAFAIVLELVTPELAKRMKNELLIPTIGIGSGPDCDGQVQVMHDLVGYSEEFVPKHARQYTKIAGQLKEAFRSYINDVRSGEF
ncbi:MAG: 3-methyl-2-oxobutanoate hydroxymethyltransferase [Armatimonadota bacterium]